MRVPPWTLFDTVGILMACYAEMSIRDGAMLNYPEGCTTYRDEGRDFWGIILPNSLTG